VIYLIGGVPTEALRHPLLCIDPFTGRADEDEMFPTHSKFWDCAEVLHGVAAGEAHYGRRAVGYRRRAFDGGGWGRVIRHVRLHWNRRERYLTLSHRRLARGGCRWWSICKTD